MKGGGGEGGKKKEKEPHPTPLPLTQQAFSLLVVSVQAHPTTDTSSHGTSRDHLQLPQTPRYSAA